MASDRRLVAKSNSSRRSNVLAKTFSIKQPRLEDLGWGVNMNQQVRFRNGVQRIRDQPLVCFSAKQCK